MAGLTALALLAPASPKATAAPPSTTCTGQSIVITPENTAGAERSLLCLINVYRHDNSLGAVTRDAALELAARRHSYDMVDRGYFAHEAPAPSPHGPWHWDRAKDAGYPADEVATGENIVAEAPEGTPFTLFESWRLSPDHNENMLTAKWHTAGIGLVRGWPGMPAAPPEPADPATFAEGATATGLFGARNRGATDTAADLAGGDPNTPPPPADDGDGNQTCDSEKAALDRGEKRLAKAKKAKKKAKRRVRRSRRARDRRKSKRKLRSKTKAVKKAKRARNKAKQRYAACLSGL